MLPGDRETSSSSPIIFLLKASEVALKSEEIEEEGEIVWVESGFPSLNTKSDN